MTTTPDSTRPNVSVGSWAILSVVFLALMCVIHVMNEGRDQGPVIWYALVLSAPFLFVAVKCLGSSSASAFVYRFAVGLSRTTRIGIVIASVGTVVGFFFTVFQMPTPLFYPSMVGAEVAARLQGFGLLMMLGLLMVQFPLADSAGRAIPLSEESGDRNGLLFGYATVLLPIAIFCHIAFLEQKNVDKAVQKSHEENQARESARQVELRDRSKIALQVARSTLHICVRSGCLDSLVRALASEGIAVDYRKIDRGGYIAVVRPDKTSSEGYETNETGSVVRSLHEGKQLVDSLHLHLTLIRSCIQDELLANWKEYPLHLPANYSGCYMKGDTTVMDLHHRGATYRVIYAAPRNADGKRVTAFTLTARPLEYGKPYIRSFLVTEDSTYVTTANRAARESDHSVRGCEEHPSHCNSWD
jgi:hypothetical protein